ENERLAQSPQPLIDALASVQLVLQPGGNGFTKAGVAHRGLGHEDFQNTLEFGQRLFVKRDIVKIAGAQPRLSKAVPTRLEWKASVVLLTTESLLLRHGNNLTVNDQRGGAIVIESRDAENRGHFLRTAGAKPWAQPCSDRRRSLPR